MPVDNNVSLEQQLLAKQQQELQLQMQLEEMQKAEQVLQSQKIQDEKSRLVKGAVKIAVAELMLAHPELNKKELELDLRQRDLPQMNLKELKDIFEEDYKDLQSISADEMRIQMNINQELNNNPRLSNAPNIQNARLMMSITNQPGQQQSLQTMVANKMMPVVDLLRYGISKVSEQLTNVQKESNALKLALKPGQGQNKERDKEDQLSNNSGNKNSKTKVPTLKPFGQKNEG